MKFENYHFSQEIKKNVLDLGFQRPTDIQFKSIPPIMKGEDVLAIAQTGTGKTLAFAIPILDVLLKRKKVERVRGIQCLVMVPTRELAIQVTEVFKSLSQNTKLKTFCVFGGVEQDYQIANLEQGIDVLVSTPGRLFDFIHQGHIKLKSVKTLVLDEADHMLDLGFIKDIQDVNRHLSKQKQTLFFSATIDKEIKKLAYSLVTNPIRIQISPKDPVAKNIDHSVLFVKMDDKRFFLERFIKEHFESKILVFVRTKVRTERVLKAMERVEIESITIHGDKEQQDRFHVLDQFKSGEVKVLIATDVTARGIDIPNVEYVINYDLPEKSENYVHRVGRTGRGKNKGHAISFCSEEERTVLEEIEGFLGKEIKVLELDKFGYQETVESTAEKKYDWQSIIGEVEKIQKTKKKKRSPVKKRKKGRTSK